jgi:murein L,D-transpeptidase YcbB/YkuD
MRPAPLAWVRLAIGDLNQFQFLPLTRRRPRAAKNRFDRILGRMSMLGARYRLVLASSALALALAIPFALMATGPDKLAAAPAVPAAGVAAGVASVEQARTPAAVVAERFENALFDSPPSDQAAAPEVIAPELGSAPDPLASLDPTDRAVAERIRDLLAKPDRFFASKKESAAAAAFYQNRNLAPLWLEKGAENARAASVVARMKAADADGLEPGDYQLPNFAGSGPEALAEAELKLTGTVLTFARHLQAGRFSYTRVSRNNIELPQALPEPADILARIADAADAGQALDAFSPQQEPYRKLKAKLAELRGKSGAAKGDVSRQVETVVANMERWRWYPRDLGADHVVANQPDFTLAVTHNGTQVWTTRIVIGKPTMPTPLLSETMKSITVNPTWHVPQSIIHNEYLPALAQDPTVLDRMGLHVSYSGGQVEITQPPGDGNALGRLRFNFPNRFSVYQHDTPDKHLFAESVRAYSHGCMRVQDPARYAEVLLNIARPQARWTAERIKSMFGSIEQDIALPPTQIWVHITYQTAFVDGAGKLQFRSDIYGLDSRTLAAIKSERGLIESAPDRKREQATASGSAPDRSPRHASTGGKFQSMSYE